MFHPTTYLFIFFSLYLRNKTWTTKVIGYLSTTTFSIGLPANTQLRMLGEHSKSSLAKRRSRRRKHDFYSAYLVAQTVNHDAQIKTCMSQGYFPPSEAEKSIFLVFD